MKKLPTIVFDMDGVLFDTIPNARENFIKKHPGVTPDMYNEIHTGNYHANAAQHAHLHVKEPEEETKAKKLEYWRKKSLSPLFDGIKELLEELKTKGYILTINTSAFSGGCLPLLENAGISDLFDFTATAEVAIDKVEKFKIIKDKYSLEYEDMIFVTDALGDVRDAKRVSVPTIAVTWGVHDKSFFTREENPHLINIVDTVQNLKTCIENRN